MTDRFHIGQVLSECKIYFDDPFNCALNCSIVLASGVFLYALLPEVKSLLGPKYEIQLPIRGLTNYTSTHCYMNSLLQLLSSMPEYIEVINDLQRRPHITSNSVLSTLRKILLKINTRCPSNSDPYNASAELINSLKTNHDKLNTRFFEAQQDCSEFWLQLNKLMEQEYMVKKIDDFTSVQNDPNQESTLSRVNWPHSFTTLRRLKCSKCKNLKEDRVEQHQMLSLDLVLRMPFEVKKESDFEISLQEYFKKEVVEAKCDKCTEGSSNPNSLSASMGSDIRSSPGANTTNTSHLKQNFIGKAPEYLCFLINSQIWTHWGGLKSNQAWSYPDSIDLSQFMWTNNEMKNECGNQFDSHFQRRYELQAVVVHIGSSNCGHYYTLRKVNNLWFECNDRKIRRIFNPLREHSPFLLLYKRAL